MAAGRRPKFARSANGRGRSRSPCYATASEIIREGLRLVEEREERRKLKLQALEIQKGFDSGRAEDVGDMFKRLKRGGRKRLTAKNGR